MRYWCGGAGAVARAERMAGSGDFRAASCPGGIGRLDHERKNVLMGFFFLLTLLTWLKFIDEQTKRPWRFYVLALVFYTWRFLPRPRPAHCQPRCS